MEERHFCLDDSPHFRMLELGTVDSTNNFLKHFAGTGDRRMMLVTAEFQSAGRGSGTNTWESAEGSNLLFSLQVFPSHLPANRMFAISEITALAVCDALNEFADGFVVKWPNDVYHADSKVVGMLIENDLQGRLVQRSIMGVGINVNQTEFLSDAPNPASLAQIVGHQVERRFVLEKFMERYTYYYNMVERDQLDELHQIYLSKLYRWNEWQDYEDKDGLFCARIVDVEPTGHLVLELRDGQKRRYEFKEVKYKIYGKI